jgi:hypothetical protein
MSLALDMLVVVREVFSNRAQSMEQSVNDNKPVSSSWRLNMFNDDIRVHDVQRYCKFSDELSLQKNHNNYIQRSKSASFWERICFILYTVNFG